MPRNKKEKHLDDEGHCGKKNKFKDHDGHQQKFEKNKFKAGKHNAFESKDTKGNIHNPFRNQSQETKNEVSDYLKDAAKTTKPWTKFRESRPDIPIIQSRNEEELEARDDNPFRNPISKPISMADMTAEDKNHYRRVITKLCAKGKAAKNLETAVELMKRRLAKKRSMEKRERRTNTTDS